MNSAASEIDFVVVGSGAAGVSACFPLLEAGRRVLMIGGLAPKKNANGADHSSHWQRALGHQLEALQADDALSPKLRTPRARHITDGFRHWSQIVENNFFAVGAVAPGGLTQIWGGLVSEFDQGDVENWPLRLEDLKPSYRAVVSRIGISGSASDDMAAFYGQSGPVLAAPPIGETAATLLKTYVRRPRQPNFSLGLARNALLTADRDGRQACDLSLGCLWGCPRGAIYDARQDLVLLKKNPRFRMLEDALVTRLTPNADGWDVSITGLDQPIRAPRVLLAAGAMGTLRLVVPLLGSTCGDLQVLHSPLLAMPMLVLKRIGGAPPQSGYTIAQLGYAHAYSSSASEYVTGAIYEVSALPPSSFVARMPFGRRAGTTIFNALAPALVVASVYFPGACSANAVRVANAGENFQLAIQGGFAPSFGDVRRKVRRTLTSIWSKLGVWALPGGDVLVPGMDAHLGGIFPMGKHAAYGTDAYGEFHVLPNLHVVDGAALPTIPSKPTTLTIMANADRVGRYLAGVR